MMKAKKMLLMMLIHTNQGTNEWSRPTVRSSGVMMPA